MIDKLEWKMQVPIFKNSKILFQLGICIGIPFGILFVVFIISEAYYAALLIVILLALTWLFVMLVYGGKYNVEYILDKKGIRCKTQEKQAKKNKAINNITVALGVLSGKPTVAGAGMLAQSRQDIFIRWSNITKAKFSANKKTIVLKAGLVTSMVVFCNEEFYPQAEEIIKNKLKGK